MVKVVLPSTPEKRAMLLHQQINTLNTTETRVHMLLRCGQICIFSQYVTLGISTL